MKRRLVALTGAELARSPKPGPKPLGSIQSLLAALLVAAGFLLTTHCARCNSEPSDDQAPVSKPAPLVTPAGWLGDFVVQRPLALWGAARRLAGDVALALPTHPALAVIEALDLPPTSADAFDLESPLCGGLRRGAGARPWPIVAIHLRSGRELVARLSSGSAPPFRARELGAGLTSLEPSTGASGAALVVLRNYLVVSPDRATAREGARFLVEGVATRPPRDVELLWRSEGDQLRRALPELLRAAWAGYERELRAAEERARADQAGRPPDFAEPEVVRLLLGRGVEAVLAVLESGRSLELALSSKEQSWTLRAELEPAASGPAHDWVAEQVVGSAEALGRLPRGTGAALMLRSNLAGRLETARTLEAGFGAAFADRLSAPARATLGRVLRDFAAGRGDTTVLGVSAGEEPGLVLQAEVGDRDRLESALGSLPEILSLEALAAPIENLFGELRTSKLQGRLAGEPFDGLSLSFGAGGRLLPSAATLALLWRSNERLHVALARAPATALLAASLATEPSFAREPEVGRALAGLGPASLVFVLRSDVLGAAGSRAGGATPPPLVVSAGRERDRGFLQAELPSALVARYFGNFEP